MIASCNQLPTCELNSYETVNSESLVSAGLHHHKEYGLWSHRYSCTDLHHGAIIIPWFPEFKILLNTLNDQNRSTNEYRNAGKILNSGYKDCGFRIGTSESDSAQRTYITVRSSFHDFMTSPSYVTSCTSKLISHMHDHIMWVLYCITPYHVSDVLYHTVSCECCTVSHRIMWVQYPAVPETWWKT